MNIMSEQAWIALCIVGVLALLALAAWFFQRRKRSGLLEHRYGQEYHRAVGDLGSRGKAEAELEARQMRVEKFSIVALPAAEAARFAQAWAALQGRFVDDPKGVIAQADELIRSLMLARGYPVSDFERRAADISVDHPAVVERYRAAQAIADRVRSGEAGTEQERQAVVHYRALFDALLVTEKTREEPVSAGA